MANLFATHPLIPVFDQIDQIERFFNHVGKSEEDGYPPYNIERMNENKYRISLALAGFSEGDIDVSIEDNRLTVRGERSMEDEKKDESKDGESTFVYRGIATRQFQRTFVLDEGVEVTSARMENGLLHIELVREAPERRVRQIAIARSA